MSCTVIFHSRLAESVQGTDFEKIFKNDEPAAPERSKEENETESEASKNKQLVVFEVS